MLKEKKIAITSVNKAAYSETFIKAQVDLLPASLVLHSGWLPTMIGDEKIVKGIKAYLNTIFGPLIKRNIFTIQGAIISILKKNKIDIVLAQYGPGGCAMLPICKKANIPLVVHFHGFDASEVPILEEYALQYQQLFIGASKVIAVSKKMEEALVRLGCNASKIVLNHYGPNDIFFQNRPRFKQNTFLGIGRFVDKKAPHLTILAFKRVVERYPDAKLMLVGSGELLGACKTLVKANQLESNVFFLGVMKPEDCRKLFEDALAFVQHSVVADCGDSEGTPVAILEASAAALPVVSTYHAGIPDVIVNNETGFLVNECDVDAMTEAMIKLIMDKELARKMGEAGRNRIKQHFAMDRYISTLKKVLSQ